MNFIRWLLRLFITPDHVDWRPDPFWGRMRRKINGEWQYREETADEAWERFCDDAW